MAPLFAGDAPAGFCELRLLPEGGFELWFEEALLASAFVAVRVLSLGRAVKLRSVVDGENATTSFFATESTENWLRGDAWRAIVEVRASRGDGAALGAKAFALVAGAA